MNNRLAQVPRLHVVSDDAVLARADVTDTLTGILAEFDGTVAVHVRGPRTPSRRIFEIVNRVTSTATRGVFVNDRVDIALACGTGVHLGARSLGVDDTRALVTPHTIIGRSVREAATEGVGADFLFAGPAFETWSHPELDGRGSEWVGSMASKAEVPVLGIGGISADRIGVLLDAGAHGVAVIRAVWNAPDPLRAVEDLQKRIDGYHRS